MAASATAYSRLPAQARFWLDGASNNRESWRVTSEFDVPNLADVWDFLVGLKETTESGFDRLSSEMTTLSSEMTRLSSEVTNLSSAVTRLESNLVRVERRVVRIEAWNVAEWLDDHERRIVRIEQQQ